MRKPATQTPTLQTSTRQTSTRCTRRLLALSLALCFASAFAPAFTTAAAAQDLPVAAPENVIPFFETAYDIELADWNNDARPDIIATAFNGSEIRMWRNETFGYVTSTWPIPGRASAIDLGDIDGNGEIDLLYGIDNVGSATDKVGVVLNRSSDFLVTVDDTNVNGTEAVRLADLDGDGDLDAITAEFGSGQVSWHENVDGDGETWTTAVVASGNGAPADVYAHDIDLDGDLDIVVATFTQLLWIENDLGSSPEWTVHTIDSDVPAARRLAIADIDGDGQDEIVAGAVNTPLLAWWDRPALLTNPWSRQVIAAQATSDVAAADIDQDGDIDLVTTVWANNQPPRFWRNDGAGAFSEQELSGSYDVARALSLGDLDLDGDLDLAVAGGNSDVVETIENRSVRSSVAFGEVEENRLLGSPLPLAMASADLDRDGDLDLVTYDEDGVLRLRDSFDSPGITLASVGETLLDARAFGLGDIDGDSDLDVVIGFAGRFAWFENLGIGQPFVPKTLLEAARTTDLMIFDLTGDGDDDLIAYDEALEVVRVWRNVGPGASWTINSIDSAYSDYRAMTAGDIDRDGTVEIIVSADGEITAYTRVADIAFQPTTIESELAPPHLVAGDFDADGDVDIAGNVPGGSTLRYWTNDGLGGWTLFESDFVASVTALAAADYDLDGDLDVVGSSTGISTAIVFTERTAPNPFSLTPFAVAGLQAELLAVGDFSGDGYADTMGVKLGGLPALSTTFPGQYTADFEPISPGEVEAGATFELFNFDLEHLGRPGDQDVELESVSLTLLADGLPLDAVQMNGLLERVTLQRIDGGARIQLAELIDPDRASPLLLEVVSNEEDAKVPAPAEPGEDSALRFRLEIELEPTPGIEEFTLRLGQASDAVAGDAMGTPLESIEWPVAQRTFTIVDTLIFADGFESGTTSAWSSSVP